MSMFLHYHLSGCIAPFAPHSSQILDLMPQFIPSQRFRASTYDPSPHSTPAPARVAVKLKRCWAIQVYLLGLYLLNDGAGPGTPEAVPFSLGLPALVCRE